MCDDFCDDINANLDRVECEENGTETDIFDEIVRFLRHAYGVHGLTRIKFTLETPDGKLITKAAAQEGWELLPVEDNIFSGTHILEKVLRVKSAEKR